MYRFAAGLRSVAPALRPTPLLALSPFRTLPAMRLATPLSSSAAWSFAPARYMLPISSRAASLPVRAFRSTPRWSAAAAASPPPPSSATVEERVESEEIQQLLQVVDLYLAGGKEQREAVLKALDRDGLRESFLELVPKVVEQRGFILDTLNTVADVTAQPIAVSRLLATDTKATTPRAVLEGTLAAPVGRAAGVTQAWAMRLATLNLNSKHCAARSLLLVQ
jgi:hypothetical protein